MTQGVSRLDPGREWATPRGEAGEIVGSRMNKEHTPCE